MPSQTNLKALGLNVSPNNLDLPEGSLLEASNVIIKRDNVIEPRRGLKLFGESFGSASDRLKQTMTYRNTLLRHYSNVLQFQNGTNNDGTANFDNFSGTFSEVETGLRMKSIESNGNLYLTTSEGIKKISATSASTLSTASGFITNAGVPKALDAIARLKITLGEQTEFFTQDSVAAYRIVWGITDVNNNLVLSTPSPRVEVFNPMLSLMLMDLANLLRQLDNVGKNQPTSGGNLSDTDYFSVIWIAAGLSINSSASELRTQLIALAAKLDADIGGTTYTSITTPSAPSTPPTHAQLVAIQDYLDAIIIALQSEPTSDIPAFSQAQFLTPIDITQSATVELEITIPEGITTSHFYQIYRSRINEAAGTDVFEDLVASDEMRLVFEGFPTSAEIAAGKLIIEDQTPDNLAGANLYTNEASGEGLLQANDLPPFAKDINKFKTHVFYANTKTRHRKLLSLLGIDGMVEDYGSGLNTKTFTSGDVNTSTETITINNHGFSDNQSIIFTNSTPSNLPGGITQAVVYYVINTTTNTFQISTNIEGAAVDITSGGTGTHTVQNVLPKLLISDGTTTNTYKFVIGRQEVTEITFIAITGTNYNGKYFLLNSAGDIRQYYFWYHIIGEAFNDPNIAGRIGVMVELPTVATAAEVSEATKYAVHSQLRDFSAPVNTATLPITTIDTGYTTDADVSNMPVGVTSTVTTQGIGESVTNKEIQLSASASISIAIDETARSLVRILNRNSSDSVYAYYISALDGIPGKMVLEARELNTDEFCVMGNDEKVGESFSPDVSPSTNSIISISQANPTVITTSSVHGLANGDSVLIVDSNSTPSVDGSYPITFISSTSFSIPVNLSAGTAGTKAFFLKESDAECSDNEVKRNRVYYSKAGQPESVPLLNYLDVGSDEDIIRIFPLRDSLFVFKKDGLFRISGETPPFPVTLFDSTVFLIAADSISPLNNNLWCWTDQGIQNISEAGANIMSRAIDTEILKRATSSYTNFSTATWGVGYHSDNSYIVWTVNQTTDTVATIAFRYSDLTSSWTTYDITHTCGLIHPVDDKLYLGAGDTNFMEVERKDFTRYDYADREISKTLNLNSYNDDVMKLLSVSDLAVGDVVVQDQTLTVYSFNNILQKLDSDSFVADNDYLSTLQAIAGDNLRTKIVALATKLDADTGISDTDYLSTIDSQTGSITAISVGSPTTVTSATHGLITGRIITISGSNSTPSINGTHEVTVTGPNTFTIPVAVTSAGTTGSFVTEDSDFDDIKANFNEIIAKLNTDTGVSFMNYPSITTNTRQETVIDSINKNAKEITLNHALDYVVGDITIYKSIKSTFTYAPSTLGDPLGWKQAREATLMFHNKAFTRATMSFATDLLPAFKDIYFEGDGSGIFGHSIFGSGFFGGASNSAPFRTYVPRNAQRCRYLLIKYTHQVANEFYNIYGVTITSEVGLSTRAYR